MNRWIPILVVAFCVSLADVGRAAEPRQADSGPNPAVTSQPATASSASDKPIHLFNGRNLDGFYTYLRDRGRDNDPNHVFSVTDGAIHVSGTEWGCITTRDEYENYHLAVEYKWGQITCPPRVNNARDSGVLLHSVGKDGVFGGAWMCSIECNVIEGGTGDFIVVGDGSDRYALTASVLPEKSAGCYVYDPKEAGNVATIHGGRLNWFARDPAWKDVKGFRGKSDLDKPAGEWNRLECLAVSDRILVKLNGVLVNSCREVKPNRGRIQLQSEGAEIFFRRVDLTPVRSEPATAIQQFSATSRPGN